MKKGGWETSYEEETAILLAWYRHAGTFAVDGLTM